MAHDSRVTENAAYQHLHIPTNVLTKGAIRDLSLRNVAVIIFLAAITTSLKDVSTDSNHRIGRVCVQGFLSPASYGAGLQPCAGNMQQKNGGLHTMRLSCSWDRQGGVAGGFHAQESP